MPAVPPGPGRQAAGLAAFNGLPEQQARRDLLACCASPRWAAGLLAGRPYRSVTDLLRESDAAVDGLPPAELREALAGHPRIGAPARQDADGDGGQAGAGQAAESRPDRDRWSAQEQAGAAEAAEPVRQALAEGNRAYEQRFGHIYLVCATGRSGAELLALLRARLGNDPQAEWAVVRSELAKINQIRLRKLIGGPE